MDKSQRYMAYNHNGTRLMKEPGSEAEAREELAEYRAATGNGGWVEPVDEDGNDL